MAYLSQEDALIHEAHRYLAHAEQEAENWPYCGHLLARALENASCATFLAWGEPHAPERKMHLVFTERLAPCLNQDVVQLVQFLWQREGHGRPDADIRQLLTAYGGAINYLASMAKSPPPEYWEPLPLPASIGWDNLSDDERQILCQALGAAKGAVQGVRLILFGSRAAGNPRPDSDYDLFFIFPNEIEAWQRGQAIGSANSLFLSRDLKTSVEFASADDWLDPPTVSRPLIERIKATGLEVRSVQ